MFCHMLIGLMMLVPGAAADEKIDGKLLVGKWEPVKLPDGVDKLVVEYSKEDKVTVEVETQGQKHKFEGKYKLEGNKLNVKIDFNGNEQDQTRKITKLTADEMVTNDDEKNEERKYKKVK